VSGAGWNVIKVLWGSDWDELFDRDHAKILLRRFEETLDAELQSYAVHDAIFNREPFFNKYEELRQLVAHLSDQQMDGLTRGGHDSAKIYADFALTLTDRDFSTTAAFARMLNGLLKDGQIGRHIVPIVADEARTFG
jgi:pyruvate dehydrogenase E1 component